MFFESAFCNNSCRLYIQNESERDSLIYEGVLNTNYALGLAKSISFNYAPHKNINIYVVVDSIAACVHFNKLPRKPAVIVNSFSRSCLDEDNDIATRAAIQCIEVRVKKNYRKISYY